MAHPSTSGSACDDFRQALPHRREILRAGGLLGMDLLLPELLRSRAQADTAARGTFGRAKSVIMLYLHGGHAQQETWDPKPDGPLPSEASSGPSPRSVPGVRISELLPRCAGIMHRLAVIRSMSHANANHVQASLAAMTGHAHPPSSRVAAISRPRPTIFRRSGPSLSSRAARRPLPTWVQVGPLMRRSNGTVLHGQLPGFLGSRHSPLAVDQDLLPDEVRIAAVTPDAVRVATDRPPGRC